MTVYVADSTCAIPEDWGNTSIEDVIGHIVMYQIGKSYSIEPYCKIDENGIKTYKLNIRDVGDGGLIETFTVWEV